MAAEPTTDAALDTFELSAAIQASALDNPYPHFAAARERGPVQREWPLPIDLPRRHADVPVFNVIGYDAVAAALRDNATFTSGVIGESMGPLAGTIVSMDEPEHGPHRALVAPAFRPKLLAAWEEPLVRRVVDETIDAFASAGRTDLVRSFTFEVPVHVIARILGLPDEDSAQFHRWSIEVVGIRNDVPRGLAALEALREYFAGVVEQKRAEPRDDLISELVIAEIDGQRLDDDELFAFLRLLLPAGIETTYRSLGSLLLGLLTNPDQLDEVRRDPELRRNAIEEGLRWESPMILLPRRCERDTVLGGVEIPAGSMVNLFTAAANHDPERFPDDPDRFDVHRNAIGHLTFSAGAHSCLGMHLARLESRIALDALLERLPDLRLDPDAPTPRVVGDLMRSPETLPVVFTPPVSSTA